MPDNFKSDTKPPTYAYIDKQRGAIDDIAAETQPLRTEEKAQRKDAEKDEVDIKDFGSGQTTGKTPAPTKTTTHSGPAISELKGAFAKCWTTVDDRDIPAVSYTDKSGYIPNCIALFQVLFSMELTLNRNEELRWISPYYFSLPVRIYYAIIFYIQTLRAREQSGTITKPESSFLRAFSRRYKDTSCPIAGPLVPILTNIVSVLPDDDQYDYVYPFNPKKGTYNTTVDQTSKKQTIAVDILHHLLPSLPMLGSFMKIFCTKEGTADKYFNDMGEYIPVPKEGGIFAGIEFPTQPNEGYTGAFAQFLYNPAMMMAPPETKSRLREIQSAWRRSSLRHFPDIDRNLDFSQSGPQDLTMLKDEFDWFEPCIDMASVQVKFFSDSTNLSNIPAVGGRSSLVIADLAIKTPKGVMDRPTDKSDWYPNVNESIVSTFKATTAELELDDKYNAMYSLTNATFSWKDSAGHKAGSKEAQHRVGPYWDNEKVTYELEHPIKVMTGLNTMIQTQFYESKTTNK